MMCISLKMNYIGHQDTRYLNAYIDYKTKEQTGEWIQCLFQIEGNQVSQQGRAQLNARKQWVDHELSALAGHRILLPTTEMAEAR